MPRYRSWSPKATSTTVSPLCMIQASVIVPQNCTVVDAYMVLWKHPTKVLKIHKLKKSLQCTELRCFEYLCHTAFDTKILQYNQESLPFRLRIVLGDLGSNEDGLGGLESGRCLSCRRRWRRWRCSSDLGSSWFEGKSSGFQWFYSSAKRRSCLRGGMWESEWDGRESESEMKRDEEMEREREVEREREKKREWQSSVLN